jgi:hypothetical protein
MSSIEFHEALEVRAVMIYTKKLMGAYHEVISRCLKTSRLLSVFLCFSTTNFSWKVKHLIVFVREHWLSGGGFRGLPQPVDLDVGFVSRKKPNQRLFAWSLIIIIITIGSTALCGPWPSHDLHSVSINQPNIECCRYIVSVTDSALI